MSEFDEITQVWKSKYLAMSLPENLLDELIAEANAEWESELTYQINDRYAILTINITDSALEANEFYKIVIGHGGNIFRGIQTTATTYVFSQIPTTELLIQVYRVTYSNTPVYSEQVLRFGYALFQHSKDESLEIVIQIIDYRFSFNSNILVNLIQPQDIGSFIECEVIIENPYILLPIINISVDVT